MSLRLPGWNRALIRWAQTQHGRPFAWGSVDCPHLVSQALEIQTGQALAIPAYTDAAGARAALAGVDDNIAAELTRQYESGRTVAVAFAQHGDIIIARTAAIASLYVLIDRRLFGVEIGGAVGWWPLDAVAVDAIAWRVADGQ